MARRHGLITSITAAHGTWPLDAHSQRNPVPGQEVTLRSTQVRRCWTLTELQHTSHTHTHTFDTHAQQVARARVRAVRPVCIGLARAMIILTHSLVSRESHLQSHFVQINPASHLLSRLVCFPHVLTLCGKCAWKFRLSNLLSARIDLPTYQLTNLLDKQRVCTSSKCVCIVCACVRRCGG